MGCVGISPCARSLPSFEKRKECRRFEVGTVTNYSPPYNRVVIFENTTAWVEARWGDRVRRTPNHTLYLDKAGECLRDQACSQHQH